MLLVVLVSSNVSGVMQVDLVLCDIDRDSYAYAPLKIPSMDARFLGPGFFHSRNIYLEHVVNHVFSLREIARTIAEHI